MEGQETNIFVGDIVKLRSKDLEMTVIGYGSDPLNYSTSREDCNPAKEIVAQWWNVENKDFSTQSFLITDIEHEDEDEIILSQEEKNRYNIDEDDPFSVGHLVNLMSGSPDMTIVGFGLKRIEKDCEFIIQQDESQIIAQWWNEKTTGFDTKIFSVYTLSGHTAIIDDDDFFEDFDSEDDNDSEDDDTEDWDSEERVMRSLTGGDPDVYGF
ncbi:hypothetical protein LC612_30340 [Nostoc sp. CHAB 5834]|nr:hypothetical protein [Nostoc sp. CHAB 5834]